MTAYHSVYLHLVCKLKNEEFVPYFCSESCMLNWVAIRKGVPFETVQEDFEKYELANLGEEINTMPDGIKIKLNKDFMEQDLPPCVTAQGARVGKFKVSEDLMRDRYGMKTPNSIMQLMSLVMIVDCDYQYHTRVFEYTAYSPLFDVLEEGNDIPEYEIEFNVAEDEMWMKACRREEWKGRGRGGWDSVLTEEEKNELSTGQDKKQ